MTALDVLKLIVAADDQSDRDAAELAVEAAREILNGDQEELEDECAGQPFDHRARMAFEIQLYLADRYNLSAIETTSIFTLALGETIAYNLRPDGSIENVIAALLPTLEKAIEFRRANPLSMGLRDIIREHKRSGGKVRHN